MKYWTWAELSQKIERDLDTEDELFVTPAELIGYANEAIDDIEKKIHTLCEDYFITRTSVPVVPGVEEITLPSDIYAMKIREVIYVTGGQAFPAKQLKNWRKFARYEDDIATGPVATNSYNYFILNSVAGSPKLILSPLPVESGVLKIWYIRNANELVNDTSILDIPEAATYVTKYCSVKIMQKELHPLLESAKADLEAILEDTIADLSQMFPNNETELEPDYTFYTESL